MNESDTSTSSRAYFPRGLFQPPGTFRFSADALLLASFLSPANDERRSQPTLQGKNLLDIGTGCGVIALSMLLKHPGLTATGVDIHPPLIQAARQNAQLLDLTQSFSALLMDISRSHIQSSRASSEAINGRDSLPDGYFDLAVANPPYRKVGHGRLPEEAAKTAALFEQEATLNDFCLTASKALKHKGKFGVIFPAARLTELLFRLEDNAFGVRRIVPVHSRAEEPACLVLVEAKKNARTDLVLESPLFLYEGHGNETHLTQAALAFCPELGTNKRGNS